MRLFSSSLARIVRVAVASRVSAPPRRVHSWHSRRVCQSQPGISYSLELDHEPDSYNVCVSQIAHLLRRGCIGAGGRITPITRAEYAFYIRAVERGTQMREAVAADP